MALTKRDWEKMRSELADKIQEVAALRSENEALRKSHDDEKRALAAEKSSEIQRLQETVRKLTAQLSERQEAQKEIAALKRKLAQNQKKMAQAGALLKGADK